MSFFCNSYIFFDIYLIPRSFIFNFTGCRNRNVDVIFIAVWIICSKNELEDCKAKIYL